MTQTTVGPSTTAGSRLTVAIPRPREVLTPGPGADDVGPLAVLPVMPVRSAPTAVPPLVDVLVAPSTPAPRRPINAPALAFDMSLALAVAGTAGALGLVPVAEAAAAAMSWPLVLVAAGHYRRPVLGESGLARSRQVLLTGIKAAVVALAVSPWLMRVDMVALAALVAILSVASTVAPLLDVRRRRPRVVLAGRPRDIREAMIELRFTDSHEVVAACLTRPSKVSLGNLPTYLGFEDSSSIAHRHGADALVVLPGARLSSAEVRRLHWALAAVGADLYIGTGLLDVEPHRTRVVSTGGIDILHISPAVLGGPRRLVKDVVERVVALAAFVVTLPLLATVCLAIRLESPGPALFRQQRIGRNGVPFTMLKLRSMGVDAEAARSGLTVSNEKDGVLFKMQLDPRVTPLGRILRRYSLDELPQLWNVVRGDMSLVGPRPALPDEVVAYDVDPRRRLVVKPGVTGLWQVSGRSDLSWSESVRLDLRYVDNWSLGLDLQILVRTVRAVLGHRGAY